MKKQNKNKVIIASNKKKLFYGLKVISIITVVVAAASAARAQGQQFGQPQYPGQYAPQNNDIINNNYNANPVANSYNSPFAGLEAPKYHPNFWNQMPAPKADSGQHVIDANVVINGILQENISSKKSKAGDVFSIMLPDDYKVNDIAMIPKNSSFVGAVVASTPAQGNANGVPGSLQVSIQTLVSPRGISIPVNAVIEYDPSQHNKLDVKKSRGIPIGEWAKSAEYGAYYTAGAIGSRLGVPFFYKGQTNSGAEFALEKGELLPVKLSQPLDVTPLAAECTQQSGPPQQNMQAEPHWQSNSPQNVPPASDQHPTFNQNNKAPMPINGQANGQNNMMPGFASPAGPEPF